MNKFRQPSFVFKATNGMRAVSCQHKRGRHARNVQLALSLRFSCAAELRVCFISTRRPTDMQDRGRECEEAAENFLCLLNGRLGPL